MSAGELKPNVPKGDSQYSNAQQSVVPYSNAQQADSLVMVEQLVKHYRLPRERLFEGAGKVVALDGVSLRVAPGKNFGIVGESGSGKSTLARLIMALESPTSGRVSLLGQDPALLNTGDLRRARRNFQMVFQDPYGSLDPRQTVARIVAEPLAAIGKLDPNTGEPIGGRPQFSDAGSANLWMRSACGPVTWRSIRMSFPVVSGSALRLLAR